QARSRLTHIQDARALRKSFGDLDDLLLRDGKIFEGRLTWDVQPQTFEIRFSLRVKLSAINQSQRPAPHRLAPQKDVLGYVEIIEHIQFLMNETDASADRVRHRTDDDLVTVNTNPASIRLIDAAEDFHER